LSECIHLTWPLIIVSLNHSHHNAVISSKAWALNERRHPSKASTLPTDLGQNFHENGDLLYIYIYMLAIRML